MSFTILVLFIIVVVIAIFVVNRRSASSPATAPPAMVPVEIGSTYTTTEGLISEKTPEQEEEIRNLTSQTPGYVNLSQMNSYNQAMQRSSRAIEDADKLMNSINGPPSKTIVNEGRSVQYQEIDQLIEDLGEKKVNQQNQ